MVTSIYSRTHQRCTKAAITSDVSNGADNAGFLKSMACFDSQYASVTESSAYCDLSRDNATVLVLRED